MVFYIMPRGPVQLSDHGVRHGELEGAPPGGQRQELQLAAAPWRLRPAPKLTPSQLKRCSCKWSQTKIDVDYASLDESSAGGTKRCSDMRSRPQ